MESFVPASHKNTIRPPPSSQFHIASTRSVLTSKTWPSRSGASSALVEASKTVTELSFPISRTAGLWVRKVEFPFFAEDEPHEQCRRWWLLVQPNRIVGPLRHFCSKRAYGLVPQNILPAWNFSCLFWLRPPPLSSIPCIHSRPPSANRLPSLRRRLIWTSIGLEVRFRSGRMCSATANSGCLHREFSGLVTRP